MYPAVLLLSCGIITNKLLLLKQNVLMYINSLRRKVDRNRASSIVFMHWFTCERYVTQLSATSQWVFRSYGYFQWFCCVKLDVLSANPVKVIKIMSKFSWFRYKYMMQHFRQKGKLSTTSILWFVEVCHILR